jgi:leucyl aminopeptidase (aminopeptidase T)
MQAVSPGAIQRAALLIVETSLGLQPAERFVVIEDDASANLGRALALAGQRRGAVVDVVHLDEIARPLALLPPDAAGAIDRAQASVFVASALSGEIAMRQQILHAVRENGLRHAHLPGIGELAFSAGLRVDHGQVDRIGHRILEKLTGASRIVTESAVGTRLELQMAPGAAWFPQFGVLTPGRWGNLPGGAIYSTPASASGVFWANASLGEFFGRREGLLSSKPVRFEIAGGRVVSVAAPNAPAVRREIETVLSVGENSDRVGVVAVGVNFGITAATGEVIVDQNMPGLHLGIGDPAAMVTGATWRAPTSFAACQSHGSVIADGVVLVDRGRVLTIA